MKANCSSGDWQNREDIRFVKTAGRLMLQWERMRAKEIEKRMFLLAPEAQTRLECIQGCIRAAKIPPISFRYMFDPVYNQINIILEEVVFSDYSYPLQEILGLVDVYSIDALTSGHLMLSANINNAAYEMER